MLGPVDTIDGTQTCCSLGRRLIWLPILGIVLFSSVGRTSQAQITDDAARPPESATISAASNASTDEAIQGRIEAIYSQIKELDGIEVRVREGVVSLSGIASNDAHASQAIDLAGRLAGVVTVQDNVERTLDLEDNLAPIIDRLAATTSRWSRALPLFLVSVAVFFAISYSGHRLASWSTMWQRLAPNAFLGELLAQTFRVVAIAIALIVALNLFGATTLTGAILGGAGVLGIAVGFAVRDSLENYIASIMLSVRQPFRANDHVLINEHEGKVARLTSRATVLLTLDGNHLRIPNSTVFKASILNFTRNSERRFDFELGVDAEDDPMAALKAGIDAIGSLEFVLSEPGPAGHIVAVGDSNIVLSFRAWVDQQQTDFLKARSLAIRSAKGVLETSGFTLPEPIYRLRLDTPMSAEVLGKIQPQPVSPVSPSVNRQSHPNETAVDSDSREHAMDVRPARYLDDKVNEERASDAEQDLLDASKPTE